MTSDAVSRVRYFPGQFLRTPDFTAEQAYHVAMRRRHNIAHHTFGIVSGLQVTSVDGRLVLEPGMAVDGYGRELVLVARTPLDLRDAFLARGTNRLDVWLAYQLVTAEPAPQGYASCTDEDTSYRLVEQPVLRYTAFDPDNLDRRRPATVPEADRDFAPDRTAPDDPLDDWPVFLATVTRNPDGTVTFDPDGRPYAGLVGEVVQAPSLQASVQIGAEHGSDPFRFAVRVTGTQPRDLPRLAVLADGTVVAVGETNLLGDVAVGGKVTLGKGTPIDTTKEKVPPAPFTLSRLVLSDPTTTRDELRLEMGSGPRDEVVVGAWTTPVTPNAEPRFVEFLTIASNQTVTVHGDLVVEGKLLDGKRRPLQLGPEAQTLVNAAFLSGVGGTSAVLGRFFPPQPAVQPQPPVVDALTVAAEAVAQDQGNLDLFAGALRQLDQAAADRLRAALEPGN